MAGQPPLKNNQTLSKRGGARPNAGRKAGVPNKATAEIKEIAQQYTQKAIKALAQIVETGESEAARVSAANAILDRAYGKPSQAIVGGGDGDKPIRHVHELSDEALAKIATAAR
jgi:hypothetical protein